MSDRAQERYRLLIRHRATLFPLLNRTPAQLKPIREFELREPELLADAPDVLGRYDHPRLLKVELPLFFVFEPLAVDVDLSCRVDLGVVNAPRDLRDLLIRVAHDRHYVLSDWRFWQR